jgi:hypothetical protein
MSEEKTVDQETYDAVADDIADFDFGRVVELMSVAEKVATIAPKNTAILGLCQAELEMFNTKAKDIAVKRAEARARVDAERQQATTEQTQRQQAEDEANAAKTIPSNTFEGTDADVAPPRESKTDKIAKSNMRRA